MGRCAKIRKAKNMSYSVRAKGANKSPSSKRSKIPKASLLNNKDTLIRNYAKLGLDLDPNRTLKPTKNNESGQKPVSHKLEIEDIETVDADFLRNMLQQATAGKPQIPKEPSIPQPEETALLSLLKRYPGRDLEKMQKDRKLNTFQWTESQIEKKLKILDKINKN